MIFQDCVITNVTVGGARNVIFRSCRIETVAVLDEAQPDQAPAVEDEGADDDHS